MDGRMQENYRNFAETEKSAIPPENLSMEAVMRMPRIESVNRLRKFHF